MSLELLKKRVDFFLMKHVFTGRRYTRAESCAPKVGSDRSRILVTLFLSRLYDSRYLLNYLVGNWFCDHKKQLNGVHWKNYLPQKEHQRYFCDDNQDSVFLNC